ncbi:MAG: hypothetical protein ACOZNI_27785 [Myxococcota bacterium]
MLLPLLACDLGGPVSGTWTLAIGAPASDCPPDEVPVAPAEARIHLDRTHPYVTVAPVGEDCAVEQGAFACELSAFDLDADYGDGGLDAVVRVDLGISGTWASEAPLAGELAWEVTCEGADCERIDAPTPCATTWTFAGERTPDEYAAPPCETEDAHVASMGALGAAPWDPVRLDFEGDVGRARLTVLADGAAIALEPYVLDGLLSAGAGLHAPAEEHPGAEMLGAGVWTLPVETGWSADLCPVAPVWQAGWVGWEVGWYGREVAFAPDLALGRWELAPEAVFVGDNGDIGSILASYAAGLRLEVLAVDGDDAEIRLVAPVWGGGGECVLLHDAATLSSTGELTWARDRIEAATDPAPLVLHAPRLRLGFDAGGADAAGGEFSSTVDVRATEGTDGDACALAVSLGASCEPCPDDGHVSCLDFVGLAWTAEKSDAPVGEDLPLCGADFTSAEIPEVDCGDWDGSLCAGGAMVVFAPLLRRRRAVAR